MNGYITGYARIPIKKYVGNYNSNCNEDNCDMEEVCINNAESILYESIMTKLSDVQFDDLEFYESEE